MLTRHVVKPSMGLKTFLKKADNSYFFFFNYRSLRRKFRNPRKTSVYIAAFHIDYIHHRSEPKQPLKSECMGFDGLHEDLVLLKI